MKYKNIELDGLDLEIDIEAAKGFIDHRALKKKPLTQRAFDQAMVKALQAFQVGMTPTELIDFTCEKGWDGINLVYTAAAKNREMMAMQETLQLSTVNQPRLTRDIPTQQMLDDTSWAN